MTASHCGGRGGWGRVAAALALAFTTLALWGSSPAGASPVARPLFRGRPLHTGAIGPTTTPISVAPGATVDAFGTTRTLVPGDIGYLRAITCPSSRLCYAVGRTGKALSSTSGTSALIVTSRRGASGRWQVTHAVAAWRSVASLTSISCTSTTQCVAVGLSPQGGGAAVVTGPGSGPGWRQIAAPAGTDPIVPLLSVSCTDLYCMAVGSTFATRWRSQIWVTTPRGPSIPAAGLSSLRWVAVGSLPIVTVQGKTYDPSLQAVSCPQRANCWAVGGGVFHTSDGGRHWGNVSPPQSQGHRGGNAVGAATYSELDSVQFWSSTSGIVGGGDQCGSYRAFVCEGAVFTTADAGRSWQQSQPAATMPFIESLACGPEGRPCIATAEKYAGSQYGNASGPVASEVLTSPDDRTWTVGPFADGLS
ncbi:MAG TPA: hypothetical protein VFN61_02460, partial [Acidimicrobiales bacterium]|nr:hypothetical protein [Acidimicrobiales bacterium]